MEKKSRVLILDDEPIVGERLKSSLERIGFEVDTFSTSQEAVNQLRSQRYDILVTDLKMRGLDGMEVLKEAKRLHPDIQAVMITGYATSETAEEALKSGAVKFIAKPFKISEFKTILLELSKGENKSNE